MDNKKKISKGLVVLLVILVVLLLMVWGFILMLFFTSDKSNEDSSTAMATEKIVEIEEIKNVMSQEQHDKAMNEEFKKKVASAEEAFNNKNLDNAIKIINEALSIKDDEVAVELKNKYIAEQEKVKEESERNIQANKENLLKNISKSYDDMKDIQWYNPNGKLEYDRRNGDESFSFYVYMGEQGNKTWLRMTTGFETLDWVFTKNIIVKADEHRFNIPFDSLKDMEGEALYGGRISEWVDILVDNDLIVNLKMVIDSSEAKVRFTGDNYYTEHTINSTQKKQLKDIIDYYELVK
jgi:flagellar basal body-associated protein FliL